jgi:restriction system protein
MKLKLSENSLFAILLRSPWWISLCIAAAFGLVARFALAQPYALFCAVAGLPFLVIGLIAAWQQSRRPSPARVAQALASAASMPWRDFSGVLEVAWQREGYAVTRLAAGEADFEIAKAGRTALVSCKRWKAASHGVEPLRALQATMQARAAQEGLYVTLADLTDQARRFAAASGIRVVRGADLAQLLIAARG